MSAHLDRTLSRRDAIRVLGGGAASLALGGLSACGAGGGNSGGNLNNETPPSIPAFPDYPLTLAPNALELSAESGVQIVSASPNSVRVAGTVPPLEPGKIILVGDQGEGPLILRVEDVYEEGSQTVLTTYPAEFTEAYSRGHARAAFPFTQEHMGTVASGHQGVSIQWGGADPPQLRSSSRVDQIPLVGRINIPLGPTGGEIRGSTVMVLSPTVLGDEFLHFSWATDENGDASLSGFRVGARLTAAFDLVIKDAERYEQPFPFPLTQEILLRPIPVTKFFWLYPTLQFFFEIAPGFDATTNVVFAGAADLEAAAWRTGSAPVRSWGRTDGWATTEMSTYVDFSVKVSPVQAKVNFYPYSPRLRSLSAHLKLDPFAASFDGLCSGGRQQVTARYSPAFGGALDLTGFQPLDPDFEWQAESFRPVPVKDFGPCSDMFGFWQGKSVANQEEDFASMSIQRSPRGYLGENGTYPYYGFISPGGSGVGTFYIVRYIVSGNELTITTIYDSTVRFTLEGDKLIGTGMNRTFNLNRTNS